MKRKKSQFLFYLFLFLNQCTYLIYAISRKYPFRNTDYNQINLFLMNMFFSLTIILFFFYAREIAASAALEVKLQNMQEIKKLQDSQSHLIRKKNREATAYQKEMLLKLKRIYQELEHDHNREAFDILRGTAEEFDTTRLHPVCADSLLNAILTSKRETAIESDIDVTYQIFWPDSIALSAQYVSCVFFNLLDNGIEACRRSKEVHPQLKLTVTFSGNSLVIHMINSKSEQEKFSGDTAKEDRERHGFGLSIIEEIVSSYDGSCEWLDHGQTFESILLLNNCCSPERCHV